MASISNPPDLAVLPDLAVRKARLRAEARARRLTAGTAAGPDAAARLAAHAMAVLPVRGGQTVAGYVPVNGEIDCRPLMRVLAARGLTCALPVVMAADAPLGFRVWREGDRLAPGRFTIPEPAADAEFVTPNLLLVPLLAFDACGHRLGYGGGYYDRTMAALRAAGPLTAVGLAFAGQEIPELPAEPFDQRLDWILTDAGPRQFDCI